jgi:alkanesulfonate monooxygenase SsuD/methylene tetrahydromethanopterin reductase-like flavin-dependent oxidoreductase (luciferase family)
MGVGVLLVGRTHRSPKTVGKVVYAKRIQQTKVTMALGFGLLSAQRVAGDSRTWEDVYGETIDLAVELERMGYGSVWTTEHHFVDDGYMPSLLVTSAAIAAATTTISIGTGVLLAPMHHPVRLAEDAATVQVISKGRLILGLGLGWSTIEYDVLGVDMATRGAALTEILQFLPASWSGDPFTWDGDIFTYPELAIRPAPAVPPPTIVGGGVDPAVRRAARFADGFFSNASPQRFVEQIRVGTDEMERIGRDPSTFRWIYYATMYPGPRAEVVSSVFQQIWKYSDMETSATRSGISPSPVPDDAELKKVSRRILGGSANEIVDAIASIREQAGIPVEWVARSYFPDLTYEQQVEVAGKLASDVMPFLPTG